LDPNTGSWRARLLSALGVQTTGYRPKTLVTDLSLGLINGVDYVLWSYAFASMLFVGGLAGHLPLAITIILISAAIIGGIVAVTSKFPVHIAGLEEQAVAILATVAIAMNARMGEFAGPNAAAATMFALMAGTALILGVCFFLAARFNLGTLIQLIPFPVVCGFLAGTGWLFFSSAIQMMTEVEVDVRDLSHILGYEQLIRWVPGLACGIAIYVVMRVNDHFFALPAALLACLAGFYGVSRLEGMTLDELRAGGWLFEIELYGGKHGLGSLDFAHVNLRFMRSVIPEVATIIMLSLLSAAFSFSALELGSGEPLDLSHELRGHGLANVTSGFCLGLPGMGDVAASVMFRRMGASSRITPLASCGLCIVAALAGGSFVHYIPKLMLGALIFLIAIHFFNDWLIEACRRMNRLDALTVWLIFGVIVVVDFLPGILVGIIWTSMVFIARFRKIEVLGSSLGLNQLSSSVERSTAQRKFLREHGKAVRIFNLRGYIFFGSANDFFERIKESYQDESGAAPSFALFNFTRVVGMDSTGAQVFVKLIAFLNSKQIKPVFCGMNRWVAKAFGVAEVFAEGESLMLDELDAALKTIEESLLAQRPQERAQGDIREILLEFLGGRDKVESLMPLMDRVALKQGAYLFRQGDSETSFYLIQSGAIEVRLEEPGGKPTRLREFRQGSVLGEMAAVTDARQRTASAVAIEDAVVYRLEPDKVTELGEHALEYRLLINELIARLLASRLSFMNERTQADV
jgi:SulP family sulfate permease